MAQYQTRKQGTAARSVTIARRQARAAKSLTPTNRAGHIKRSR